MEAYARKSHNPRNSFTVMLAEDFHALSPVERERALKGVVLLKRL
jgi:hypothetical protein